jgi:hypothetical protein
MDLPTSLKCSKCSLKQAGIKAMPSFLFLKGNKRLEFIEGAIYKKKLINNKFFIL